MTEDENQSMLVETFTEILFVKGKVRALRNGKSLKTCRAEAAGTSLSTIDTGEFDTGCGKGEEDRTIV